MINKSIIQSLDKGNFRKLSNTEIDQLKDAQNISDEWKKLFVSKVFNPSLIRNCHFVGENFIADLTTGMISSGNISLPTGLYNSTFSGCILQKNIAIHNVNYLSNYSIGEGSLLFNVNEISCSENPTFGNGYDNKNRNWINIANENGGRKILPFEGILTADAFLWSRFREDTNLMKRLEKFTDKIRENNNLSYGKIDRNCVIKNVKSIEDCKIGSSCIIDGANRLTNLTIQSTTNEPTYIGDDVELVDGIIGFNNTFASASKCFNFITGRNVKIELGARILHTFVGSNSSIACCEVLNNLIFPFHEQHHNNSFLIASTVMGQSNIAAGATIGSNHNSRAADGEILAMRGFWPGLESDFKHNSVFASFTLVAKGSYETELDVKLPFSLVSKDLSGGLQIFPAFWFRYNMYALARNSWKFKVRDKRKIKAQNIEMDYLAPDIIFEIMSAIAILEDAIEKSKSKVPENNFFSFQKIADLNNVFLNGMAPKSKTQIIKPLQALWIYRNLIWYFAAREIINTYQKEKQDVKQLFSNLPKVKQWHNFGGQLISEEDIQNLIEDIKNNKIVSWNNLHQRYNDLWQKYPENKLKFALACWTKLENLTTDQVNTEKIKKLIEHSINFNNALLKWTIEARKKDYDNPFRQSTFRNPDEMNAVLSVFEDDTFIIQMNKENREYIKQSNTVISKL